MTQLAVRSICDLTEKLIASDMKRFFVGLLQSLTVNQGVYFLLDMMTSILMRGTLQQMVKRTVSSSSNLTITVFHVSESILKEMLYAQVLGTRF